MDARPRIVCIAQNTFHQSETYLFEGIDGPAFAAVRHALFRDVPCLALAIVTILESSAEWPRDFIAHRIGQIPVKGVDRMGVRTDGQGAVFEVHVAAPAEHDMPCAVTIVHSTDFHLRRHGGGSAPQATLVHSCSAEECAVVGDQGLQVVALLPGQKIHARATAWRGTGRQHPRWICCQVAQLEYAPRRVLRVRTTGAVTAREALVAALRTTRERMLVLLATM
jgi:hypothetical protein